MKYRSLGGALNRSGGLCPDRLFKEPSIRDHLVLQDGNTKVMRLILNFFHQNLPSHLSLTLEESRFLIKALSIYDLSLPDSKLGFRELA